MALTKNKKEESGIYYPLGYPNYLPKRSDPKYVAIENFADYEFTNNIAYEILIRTKEYKELINTPLDKRGIQWEKDVLKLGLNPSLISDLVGKNIHFWDTYNNNHSFFYSDTSSFCINDIENGLELLIKFYIKKNKIYSINNSHNLASKYNHIETHIMKKVLKNMERPKYKHEKDLTFQKIIRNKKKYYILGLLDRSISDNSVKQGFYELNGLLSIEALEKDFLETVKHLIPLKKNRKVLGFYSRPVLKFQESTIVDISLNLDLPEKELFAYIKKLKEEHSKNLIKIKNLYEVLNEEVLDKEEKEIKKNKKYIADSIFCYDYYHYKKEYIENKNNKIKIINEENTMLQEKQQELEQLNKEKIILEKKDEILIDEVILLLEKDIYKEEKKEYPLPNIKKSSKNYIFADDTFKYSDINKATAYNYYCFIKPFIENLEYKQLIHAKKID